jgi:mono/diheme cytochrome c family protein
MKRVTLYRAASLIVVAGLISCAAMMWRPSIDPLAQAPTIDDASARRGARVAEQGDCAVCHTRPGGAYMAGGLPLVTPFGTLYTTNITPDRDTGIGNWPPEAFARAMRHGVSRDGHFLYPAFPYVHYSRMSDADISDVYAYLMSVDPVPARAPDNHMMFPMNFRPLVSFWNLLFLRDDRLADLPDHSPQWNRGRYLVEGAGHCSSCHTPLNFIGGEKNSEHLSGGLVDGWNAPALTGMARRSNPWTTEQLVTYLRAGVAGHHGAAAGPMLPVSLSLAQLPETDAQAIAGYILSLDSDTPTPAANCAATSTATIAAPSAAPSAATTGTETAGAGSAATVPAIAVGEALFAGACAGCHGGGAPMRTIDGRPGLSVVSAATASDPRNLIKTILEGIPMSARAPSHYMPPFADTLDDAHIAALAGYLRSQACAATPWPDLLETVHTLRHEGQSK